MKNSSWNAKRVAEAQRTASIRSLVLIKAGMGVDMVKPGWLGLIFPILWMILGCGTGADRYDNSHVSAGLESRTGRKIGPGDGSLPQDVTLEDGITEDEAVSIALWNNAAFQEALSELGLKRADLVQAGMLPNPTFSILFPLGPKQLEFNAKFALDALWLRPGRIAAAEIDCERVSALLVQSGLDLVRDVRTAFAEMRLARARVSVLREAASLREKARGLARARLLAGDISQAEADAADLDAIRAKSDAARSVRDLDMTVERIRTLLGLSPGAAPMTFQAPPPETDAVAVDFNSLWNRAQAARPDLRAAELALDAARERAELAEFDFLQINAVVDANAKGSDGFEIGPGLDIPIPIFNQGQGAQARAAAELGRAARHQAALRHRIALEVREARSARSGAAELLAFQSQALILLREATQRVQRAEFSGDVPPSATVESRLRLLEGQLREAEAQNEFHRTNAQLERSVGGRLP